MVHSLERDVAKKKQPAIQDEAALSQHLEEFRGPSARGMVLAANSYIDAGLAEILADNLKDLDKDQSKAIFEEESGALASLSRKINMAHALGLISKELRVVLHALRKVRNSFAHNVVVSFDDKALSASVLANYETHFVQPFPAALKHPDYATARECYQHMCNHVVTMILGRSVAKDFGLADRTTRMTVLPYFTT